MSSDSKTLTTGTGSAKPFRRRRTRVASDKRIADDEFMAAAIGDVEWLKQSLREGMGEINYDKNGLTALHLAAIHGRLDCLKLLLEKYKFDINLASTTGWRAIHLCISNQTGRRAIQCLEYLLDKKADPSVANNDGITPVHQAASEGHVQCLKMLIDVGAKIDGEDCRGHTPLDLAKLWSHRKCARIIAAEMWHQGKDNVAKEMQQLKQLKMQQVLKELEEDEKYKTVQELNGVNAFKEWLTKRNLKDAPTGPKGRENGEKGKDGKETKDSKVEHKTDEKKVTIKESLSKPNSVVTKSTDKDTKSTKTKTQKSGSPGYLSSRRTTNLSQILEDDLDHGLHEQEDREEEMDDNGTENTKSFVNPNRWKIPLKVDDPPYLPNLPDDYPRDEYTMMPHGLAPKYFDGKHGQRIRSDDENLKKKKQELLKKDLRKPNLPPEVIQKELSEDSSLYERPVVFKPKHINDVNAKKKYSDDVRGKSEVSLHLCDDMSSYLFKNSLKSHTIMTFDLKGTRPSDSSSSSYSYSTNWKSARFPREKVINSLRTMAPKKLFQAIRGEECDLNTGQVPIY
ncbi:hypothetical protein ACJMK2_006193 [Sinanodonta woodiana]|uniref:Ankyrin repeat domain-containing protein 53 n=1 Tax=Sinanodonta woodiana TaxID=1069815 RepID=A0ABD3VSE1_SINWO